MLPVTLTYGGLAAASANNICQSQTPGATGVFTLNGSTVTAGVAILDVARRVLFTPAGNETGKTVLLTGTNSDGNPIQETLAGTNATAFYSSQDFKTVTAIVMSAAAAGAFTVGTNTIASSPWKVVNMAYNPYPVIAWATTVSGTINYDLEYTMENPNNNANTMGPASGNYPTVVTPIQISAMAGKTGAAQGSMTTPFYAWRVKINSGTGTVTAIGQEAGLSGP